MYHMHTIFPPFTLPLSDTLLDSHQHENIISSEHVSTDHPSLAGLHQKTTEQKCSTRGRGPLRRETLMMMRPAFQATVGTHACTLGTASRPQGSH